MNNKKIIFGAVWIVGLFAIGFGGYWYFSGGAGLGGDVAWSNGVALVEGSWDEAVGLPRASSSTAANSTIALSGADSGLDDEGQGADQQSEQAAAPVQPGPPPVYSIADIGSAAATDSDAAAASAASAPEQPVSVPVVTYSAPTSSVEMSTTMVTTTIATTTVASTSTPTPAPEPAQPMPTSTATSTPVAESAPSQAAPSVDHPIIVQVQIAGAASSNDFVKIFNPTGAAVDLTGWKLHKKSSTGADYSLKTFPTGMTIASGAYLTWANSENGFADSIDADVSSTETLAADNSVALMDPSDAVIDAIAWGTGANQYVEGDAYPTDPTANQILVRNSANGAIVDTDDNANDFTIQ
jgi:hypothetical protein